MRVMVIVKATQTSEAGGLPSPELLAAMGKYNEELEQAGILLAADGLRSTRRGHACGSRARAASSPTGRLPRRKS